MKKILSTILMVLFVVGLVFAAGPTEKASADAWNIKVSGQPYIHSFASVYAIDKGYFNPKDKVVDMYSGGPVQNEAIASKAWDVGTTGTGGIVLGAVGYNLKAIAFTNPDQNTIDMWVRPNSPLAKAPKDSKGVAGTAKDWRGKTILCQSGTSCQMLLIGVLDHLGLKQTDVKLIDTSVADGFAAFKAGTGDIVALWSPFGFLAQETTSWVKIACSKDLGLVQPCVVVATEDAIRNNWDGVYAYLKGYLKAADDLRSNPEMAANLLYKFEEEQGIIMSKTAAFKEVTNRPFPTTEQNIKLFTKRSDGGCQANDYLLVYAEFFKSQGKINQTAFDKIKRDGMVDTSFMEAYKAGK